GVDIEAVALEFRLDLRPEEERVLAVAIAPGHEEEAREHAAWERPGRAVSGKLGAVQWAADDEPAGGHGGGMAMRQDVVGGIPVHARGGVGYITPFVAAPAPGVIVTHS